MRLPSRRLAMVCAPSLPAVGEIAPALLFDFHTELFRGGSDTLPRGISLGVCYTFHLFESRDGVADVLCIIERFLLLFREGIPARWNTVAFCLIECCHVLLDASL